MKDFKFLIGLLLVVAAVGCTSANKNKSDGAREGGRVLLKEPGTDIDKEDDSSGSGAQTSSVKVSADDAKYSALSKAYRAQKGQELLNETYKILSVDPQDPIALNTLALYYMKKQKYGAARILIGRALAKPGNRSGLYNNLGVIALNEGEVNLAIAQFKKAIRAQDDHPEALGNLASIYLRNGEYLKAQQMLDQAYKKHSQNAAIANNYAIILRNNKNFAQAKSVYEDILKQDSRNVVVLLNYAILLVEHMNKPKEGLALVYKLKLLETERDDILRVAADLERKAKAAIK